MNSARTGFRLIVARTELLSVLLVMAWQLACMLPVRAQSSTSRVHDSAGVLITENTGMRTVRVAFRLGARPTLDLGGLHETAALEFSPTSDWLTAVRLSDGGVVVADAPQLKFFSPQGKLVRAVGQSGGGPQEFKTIEALCRTAGDSIIALDDVLRKAVVYSSTGAFVRSVRVPGEVERTPCLSDGTLVVRTASTVSLDGRSRAGEYSTMRSDGTGVTSLGSWPRSLDLLFDTRVGVVAGVEEIFVADPTADWIGVYGRDGRLRRVIKTGEQRMPLSAADIARALHDRHPTGYTTKTEIQARDRVLSYPRPAFMPYYYRMLVDDSSRIWLVLRSNRGEPQTWIGYDHEGRLIGKLLITVPTEASWPRMVAIRGNEAVVRYLDDDGAAHLAFYPIVRIP